MKVSLRCLNKLVDVEEFFHQPHKLATLLSMKGLEVDEWEDLSPRFCHIVVGEVQHKKKHPTAHRLQLCQIQVLKSNLSSKEPLIGTDISSNSQSSSSVALLSIVCGASNFQEGDKVVVALPGAVVLSRSPSQALEQVKIKTRKIRDQLSQGMLMAFGELFPVASSAEEGIIVLPKSAKVGESLATYLGLDDIIFKLNITPNRADCLSHFGLARELACLLNRSMKWPRAVAKPDSLSMSPEELTRFYAKELESTPPALSPVKPKLPSYSFLCPEIKQTSLCWRYTGRALYGVKVQSSPLWLKTRLLSLGLKPINNLVDVTNYLMVQFGQPLHAFDSDRLSRVSATSSKKHTSTAPLKIVVDVAQKGEKLHTLDGDELSLNGGELCIRDGQGPVALAGVIGGMSSGIHADTKNVFVESACFNPITIRRTAKKFGIETDSSYRFSRGVSSFIAKDILQQAVFLMNKLGGGVIADQLYDVWPQEREPVTPAISICISDVERRLGWPVNKDQFQEWMKRLYCLVSIKSAKRDVKTSVLGKADDMSPHELLVKPPFFRNDLHIKEDLMEEYARLEGYDQIPEKATRLSTLPRSSAEDYILRSRLADLLSRGGFYEAINHSFISQEFSHAFFMSKKHIENQAGMKNILQDPSYKNHFACFELSVPKVVSLLNPLSAEYDIMRVSLLPSLFKNAEHSIRRGCLLGQLFELGEVFVHNPSTSGKKMGGPYSELSRLSLITWGQEEGLWEKPQRQRPCIYSIKRAVTLLLDNFGVTDFEWVSLEDSAPRFIHPCQFLVLKIKGQKRGYIGSLHPVLADEYKIRLDMALAELSVLPFEEVHWRAGFQALSPFPQVERDMSFIVPEQVPAGVLMKDLKEMAGPLCRSVKIFDIYKGDKQQLSIAFRFTLQSDEKTLTETELKDIQDNITHKIMSKWPVQLRR